MNKTVPLILAALLMCAPLFAACGETAGNTPAAGLPDATPEISGVSEAGGIAPEEREEPSGPAPGSAPAPSDAPGAEPDPSGVEPGAPGAEPDAEPEAPDAEPPPVRLGETPDAGREYLDKLFFLGDSTTYWLGYYYAHGYSEDLVPSSHIWTGASGTMTLAYYATTRIVYETGEEISIREAVERTKPEYLVITLGVNGISFMDEEWFVRDYTDIVELVKEASPETKIILNSIFPISTTYPYQRDVNNDKIRAANGWIEQIAADTGTRFLNSFECVVGEDGNLPVSSSMGDGLHLSAESFRKVMYYFRTHEYR